MDLGEVLHFQVLLEEQLQRLHLGPGFFDKDLGALSHQEGLAITDEEESLSFINHEVDRSSSTHSNCICRAWGELE